MHDSTSDQHNAPQAKGLPDHIGEKKRKPRASRGFQEAKSSI
jgi:hypothetical protein